jgi:protein TonB
MPAYATPDDQPDRETNGFAAAILLHVVIVVLLLGWAFVQRFRHPDFGESTETAGAIQASIVNAIPLPPKAPPVQNSVLASPDITKSPAPQPTETTAPPPRPTDIPIKAPEKTVTKTAPTKATAVKHPQPVPQPTKANSGDQATQLPESTMQTVNGTATVTVQNRTLGERYAYYIRLISTKVQQTYSQEYPDPRSSAGKSVTVTFYVDTNGAPADIQLQTPSGSPTLDQAGKRAVEEIDTFGPNPSGQKIPIEFTFNYRK